MIRHPTRGIARLVCKNYMMLGVSSAVMLILMYVIMFTMIYSLGEFIQNINFFYMAIMMATPMTVMMPLLMSSMYPDQKLNLVVYVGCGLLFVAAFVGIRSQLLVGDRQFLRSMIPHHSGAVLMSRRRRSATMRSGNYAARSSCRRSKRSTR